MNKVKDLFGQKTQRQGEIRQIKLPLQLSSLLLQILFIVNFSIRIFASNIFTNFKRHFKFLVHFLWSELLLFFSNTFLRARILHEISEPFIPEFLNFPEAFSDSFNSYYRALRRSLTQNMRQNLKSFILCFFKPN